MHAVLNVNIMYIIEHTKSWSFSISQTWSSYWLGPTKQDLKKNICFTIVVFHISSYGRCSQEKSTSFIL